MGGSRPAPRTSAVPDMCRSDTLVGHPGLRTPPGSATRAGVKRARARCGRRRRRHPRHPALARGREHLGRRASSAPAGDRRLLLAARAPGPPRLQAREVPAAESPGLPARELASKNFFVFVSGDRVQLREHLRPRDEPRSDAPGAAARRRPSPRRRESAASSPRPSQLKIIPLGGTSRLAVLRGRRRERGSDATIKPKGSTLTYDSRYCRAAKVPGVH